MWAGLDWLHCPHRNPTTKVQATKAPTVLKMTTFNLSVWYMSLRFGKRWGSLRCSSSFQLRKSICFHSRMLIYFSFPYHLRTRESESLTLSSSSLEVTTHSGSRNQGWEKEEDEKAVQTKIEREGERRTENQMITLKCSQNKAHNKSNTIMKQ